MDHVFRSPVPPKPSMQLWVRRLKEGERAIVVCLSEYCMGYRLHWTGRRTVPCIDPVEVCSGCARGLPVKWKAYLHVYHIDARRQEILEIPESTWRKLSHMPCYDNRMRGAVLGFARQQSKRGTIGVWNEVSYLDLGPMPPAKDILPDLMHFWTGQAQPSVAHREAPVALDNPDNGQLA
jgi:hypothetical protein